VVHGSPEYFAACLIVSFLPLLFAAIATTSDVSSHTDFWVIRCLTVASLQKKRLFYFNDSCMHKWCLCERANGSSHHRPLELPKSDILRTMVDNTF
jgi:hypothetical protein